MLAVLLLGGCSDTDWDNITSFPSQAGSLPRPASMSMQSDHGAVVASCVRAADERATDVADQGFDADLQRAAHDQVYAECLAGK